MRPCMYAVREIRRARQTVVAVTHARYVREHTDRLLDMRDEKPYTQIPDEEE